MIMIYVVMPEVEGWDTIPDLPDGNWDPDILEDR
jgi:hypothetical protein